MEHTGTHLIVDLWNCGFNSLNNKDMIEADLINAAVEAGCTVLHSYSHAFDPQGVTAIVVLAESHISIHTYPEKGYAALDIFTCGTKAMPQNALTLLLSRLKPRLYDAKTLERG
jgi:S-adenosylmethionine decarboxylase